MQSRPTVTAQTMWIFLTFIVLAFLGRRQCGTKRRDIRLRERQLERQIAEHNAVEAERRAWLAEVAAQEVRRQSDELMAAKKNGAGARRLHP